MASISILGVTGSIGQSTLRVLRAYPEQFQCIAFSAHCDVAGLTKAALEFRPQFVAIGDETKLPELQSALAGTGIICGAGEAAILEAAAYESDILLGAISGAAALRSSFVGAKRGARLALANKESIVCAGALLKAEVARSGGMIVPVDSEHAGLFRLLHGVHLPSVEKLILTASGGAFRDFTHEQLKTATPAQALKHPNWNMGQKITIDSASLFNKALELLEAHILFEMPEQRIDVVIEPRSMIHALVEFADGSITAEYSMPDMAMPIAAALFWPKRLPLPTPRISLTQLGAIEFFEPDHTRFPALNLARWAIREGGALPIVLNAANEVAVDAFLREKIGFLDINTIVERTMNTYIQCHGNHTPHNLEDVIIIDTAARSLSAVQ